jgi:hypothetical protein
MLVRGTDMTIPLVILIYMLVAAAGCVAARLLVRVFRSLTDWLDRRRFARDLERWIAEIEADIESTS